MRPVETEPATHVSLSFRNGDNVSLPVGRVRVLPEEAPSGPLLAVDAHQAASSTADDS